MSKQVKEIGLSPNIGEADLQRKINQSKKFLREGLTVRVNMLIPGRWMKFQDDALSVIQSFGEQCLEFGKIISPPKLNGNRFGMTIGSKGKK